MAIYLLDFSGKLVKNIQQTSLAAGLQQEEIHFDNSLPPGLYQIILQTDAAVFSEKIKNV